MKGYIYILTTVKNPVLYTGVTSDLKGRINKHKQDFYPGSFTRKYNVKKLVYYEVLDSMGLAIKREKQIKSWSRKRKIELINAMNPEWVDLTDYLPD